MTLRFNDYFTKILPLIIFSVFLTACKPTEKAAKIILSKAQDIAASPKITISNFSLGGRKVQLTLRLMNKDDIKNIMSSDFSFFTMGGADDGVFSQVVDEGEGVFSVVFTGAADGTKDVFVKIKGKKSETSAPNVVISSQPSPGTSNNSNNSNNQSSSNNAIVNTPPRKPQSFACSTSVVASSTGNSCSIIKATPADLDNNTVTYVNASSTCPSVVVNASTGIVTFSAPASSTCVLKVKAYDGLAYSAVLSKTITLAYDITIAFLPAIQTQHTVITIKNTLEYSVSNIANYVLSATDGSLTFNTSTGSGVFTPTKIGTAYINLQNPNTSALIKATIEVVPALAVGLEEIPVNITKRSYHSASVIEGRMYIFGGLDYSESKNFGDLFVFDPNIGAQGIWSKITPPDPAFPLPQARRAHTSAAISGKMYVFGGYTNEFKNDLWSFDPSQNKWTKLNPTGALPPARALSTASVVGDKMYIIGGTNQAGNLNDVWVYTPSVNGSQDYWEQINLIGLKIPARSFHSAAVVANKIYIYGGSSNSGHLNDIWVFDPAQGTWDELNPSAPLPPVSRAHSASVIDGKIYIFGGNGGVSIYASRNETWVFDPSTAEGSWSQVAAPATLPSGRIAHSASVISNKIFVYGGIGADTNLNDTWAFTPTQSSWVNRNTTSSTMGEVSYTVSGGVKPVTVSVSQGIITNGSGSGVYRPAPGSGQTNLTITDAIGNTLTLDLGSP
jgi:N-acetylneuraminic acid mutarotase